MVKIIKKLILSLASILGLSLIIWTVFLLNPSLSYAHQTQLNQVTVYHNQELQEGVEQVINDAIHIIKKADIYDHDVKIQLCLNDDKLYPKLHPFAGGTAYAFFNKTVIYASEPHFKKNTAEFKWEINDYELRKYNLTNLLAHEFTHNLQSNYDVHYYITSTLGNLNWKLEGHAEYISREFKNDDRLKEKIKSYLIEEKKDHKGVPVFHLEDGTIQNLSYYKYAIVVQYLMEIKELNFSQLCELELSLDDSYTDMIEWSKNSPIDEKDSY